MYSLINEKCCICFNTIELNYKCKSCNCVICSTCINKLKGKQCHQCEVLNTKKDIIISNKKEDRFCITIIFYGCGSICFIYISGLLSFFLIQITLQLVITKKLDLNNFFVISHNSPQETRYDLINVFLFTPILLGLIIFAITLLGCKCVKMICL